MPLNILNNKKLKFAINLRISFFIPFYYERNSPLGVPMYTVGQGTMQNFALCFVSSVLHLNSFSPQKRVLAFANTLFLLVYTV